MNRSLAQQIVKCALLKVADFNIQEDGDIEAFDFTHFTNYHKSRFAAALVDCANETREDDRFYNLIMNSDIVGGWQTMKDCVDYVLNDSFIDRGATSRLNL
jgi:hypothetical protein